jgi:CRP/FNR family transcriptional regulator, cyclic AMP receptor protein
MIMTGCRDEIPRHAFHFLSSEDSAVLLPAATRVVVKKGEELFRAGEGAEEVFFLESGKLAVMKETGFNDRTQVVALLEPGASVGEGGALGDSPRSATILAIEESLLFCLRRSTLIALTEKNPQLLIKIFKRLLSTTNLRLQKSSERLAHIL